MNNQKYKNLYDYVQCLDDNEVLFMTQTFNTNKITQYKIKTIKDNINYHLNKLSSSTKTTCPIIIRYGITSIDNIGLFIACLKLNITPIIVNEDETHLLDEYKNTEKHEHCFGIFTSGSTNKKLIFLSEEKMIEKVLETEGIDPTPIITANSITGISGIENQIFYPILKKKPAIITSKNEIFDTAKAIENIFAMENKNRKYELALPVKCEEILKQYKNNLDPSKIKQINIGGGIVNINIIRIICNTLKISPNIINIIYGQTEAYGMISSGKLDDARILTCRTIAYQLLDEISFENNSIQKFDTNDYKEPLYKTHCNSIISVGKTTKKISIKKIKQHYGEIIYNGLSTGDIGYIDEEGYLYVINRYSRNKEKPYEEKKQNEYMLNDYLFKTYGEGFLIDLSSKTLIININKFGMSNIFMVLMKMMNDYFFQEFDITKLKYASFKKSSNLNKDVGYELFDSIHISYIYRELVKSKTYVYRNILMYFLNCKTKRELFDKLDKINELLDNPNISQINEEELLKLNYVFSVDKIIKLCKKETFQILFEEELENREELHQLYTAGIKKNIFGNKIKNYTYEDINKILSKIIHILKSKNVNNADEQEALQRLANEWEEHVRNEHKSKSI